MCSTINQNNYLLNFWNLNGDILDVCIGMMNNAFYWIFSSAKFRSLPLINILFYIYKKKRNPQFCQGLFLNIQLVKTFTIF